ncbi:VQ motif-containing protein 22 [Sesamum alatum]|uniref:VQ motif-containing protein 22 n=1 Tax=Sesamum alatum TaxID=300844 RepID=A0AAE1YEF4_9LAMI|nr:VQ motif-containing protein 22 [Sesamum alatum]
MDSGNSGSLQSSSGGDDQEFDSRGESSISSFLNPSSHDHFGSISAQHPPFLTHQIQIQNPTFFDPHHLSQNLDHQYSNDNDLIWSRSGLRSEPNFPSFGNLTVPSSSLPSSRTRTNNNQPIPSVQPPFPAVGPSSSSAVQPDGDRNVIKNPKKRTRASRRAPTTVLTTDTSNFRQMVQEFTGIPAAPFSGSSPYSRRLDLFSAASALRAADTLGPLYPLRPSAHKVLSPFSSSHSPLNSTMIDAIAPATNIGSTSNNTNTAMSTTTAAAALGGSTPNISNSFALSGDHHHHLLINLQNQNILSKPDHLPVNFSSLSGLLSRETPSASAAVRNNNHDDDNIRTWRSGETVRSNDGVEENLVGFDGNIDSSDSQRMSGYNLNLTEKGMENVVGGASASGAEGTVASWICPSD